MAKSISAALAAIACLAAGSIPAAAHEDLHTRISDLDTRIAKAPDADLYARRADLHRRHRDWAKALKDYASAAALDSEDARIEIGRARVHLDRGAPKAALRSLSTVLSSKPRSGIALILKARALTALSQTDQAHGAFSAAIRALDRPLPEHYIEHAHALASAEPPRLAAAIKVLDDGMKRLGDLISLESHAYELERQAGKLDAALYRTRRMIASPAGLNPAWLLAEGELLGLLGQTGKARESYVKALAEVQSSNARRRRATPAAKAITKSARSAIDALDAQANP